MKHHLIKAIVFQFLLTVNLKSVGQMRVLFSDSLEQRADLYKITSDGFEEFGYLFTKSKFSDFSVRNFSKETRRDTISIQQGKKRVSFLNALLDKSQGLLSKADHIVGEFARIDSLSYGLVSNKGDTIIINAVRTKTERVDQIKTPKSNVSNIVPDTSYVSGTIDFTGISRSCAMEILFRGDEPNSINGFLYFGSDTLLIRSADKSKKGKSSGVELVSKKTIGGLQLPLNHIGPAFFVIDKQLDTQHRAIAFAALSAVLIINENRNWGY